MEVEMQERQQYDLLLLDPLRSLKLLTPGTVPIPAGIVGAMCHTHYIDKYVVLLDHPAVRQQRRHVRTTQRSLGIEGRRF
jgi:hypothetical protein